MSPEELERLALEGRPLEYLNLPQGVINRLNAAYIYSIGDLLGYDPQRLSDNVNEFGPKSMEWVVKALDEVGLKLPPRQYKNLR